MRAAFVLLVMIAASVVSFASGVSAAGAGGAPIWEGFWAQNPEWCERAGQPGEETPDWYGRDGLFGLEWSCDVISATPTTGVGQSFAMQLDCLEMGDSYREAAIWMVTPQDRLRIVTSDGEMRESVRCADPEAADAPARLACDAKGGTYRRGGLLQHLICFEPTPDAGKACAKASDCSGFCLADIRTCATVKPLFGCHNLLAEDGATVGLCVD